MTNYKFNVDEIFEIAAQIERNGADFYRQASARFSNNNEIQKVLNELAVCEDNHEKIFLAILHTTLNKEGVKVEDDLTRQYLDTLAGQFIFNNETSTGSLIANMSKDEIFDTAILKEKDSILFYVGLKNTLSSEDDKKAIDLIIEEEQKHLVDLRNYREILKYNNERY